MLNFELAPWEIERMNQLQTVLNFAPVNTREYQLARAELNEMLYGVSELGDRML